MEIDDKGGEVGTKICKRYVNASWGRSRSWKLDMDKEGATLKNEEGSILLGQEKDTSREQAHELGCLHLICAYSCACLHCISFKLIIHACVVYASCRI